MDALEALAAAVGRSLERSGDRLVTAESCTGGWVAEAVTAIPGSSAWFERGFVTYSDEAKQELLGVPARTLASHGAVSAETVAAMARGALAASHATVAVAVSGIAGPGGGSRAKPVGTVWIGWARADGWSDCRGYRLDGDRRAVRLRAVELALERLLDIEGR